MPQNLPEQMLMRIVRLSADGNYQREVGVSRMHKQNFATQVRDWPTTSDEAWRFDENLHATERSVTTPNGQNEPLRLGSSAANADDPPNREMDVSSNHSETASGRRILVSASRQVSWAHFGAQATPPLMAEEARSVGPQTMETLYLQ